MPMRYLLALLFVVIAAAALTIFALNNILSLGEAMTGAVIILFALVIRLLSYRK